MNNLHNSNSYIVLDGVSTNILNKESFVNISRMQHKVLDIRTNLVPKVMLYQIAIILSSINIVNNNFIIFIFMINV